jgi:hypothetical protein
MPPDSRIDEIAKINGAPRYLHDYVHEFQRTSYPIHSDIIVDEETFINHFGFIQLMRIFGIKIDINLNGGTSYHSSIYMKRLMNEDPCYVFACMTRNDAGWCDVWRKTKERS